MPSDAELVAQLTAMAEAQLGPGHFFAVEARHPDTFRLFRDYGAGRTGLIITRGYLTDTAFKPSVAAALERWKKSRHSEVLMTTPGPDRAAERVLHAALAVVQEHVGLLATCDKCREPWPCDAVLMADAAFQWVTLESQPGTDPA